MHGYTLRCTSAVQDTHCILNTLLYFILDNRRRSRLAARTSNRSSCARQYSLGRINHKAVHSNYTLIFVLRVESSSHGRLQGTPCGTPSAQARGRSTIDRSTTTGAFGPGTQYPGTLSAEMCSVIMLSPNHRLSTVTHREISTSSHSHMFSPQCSY